jgi:hypothetical protein
MSIFLLLNSFTIKRKPSALQVVFYWQIITTKLSVQSFVHRVNTEILYNQFSECFYLIPGNREPTKGDYCPPGKD